MATLQTWRKAYGALKDRTKVSLAQINRDNKDLEIAIVKATNHVECPPKERHLRKILMATSVIRPRADIAYCIHVLARRLAKTRNWTVALKTLIVVHRLLRRVIQLSEKNFSISLNLDVFCNCPISRMIHVLSLGITLPGCTLMLFSLRKDLNASGF